MTTEATPGPGTAGTPPAATPVGPGPIAALTAVYGPPSQAGFGSAVFHGPLAPTDDLEQVALARYEEFVGDLWQRFGAEAWLGTWRSVYQRPPDARRDILAELRAIPDRETAGSVDLLLEAVDNAAAGRAALSAVYDDPAVSAVEVFAIGDGAAISGLLIAGRRTDDTAVVLVLLMD